MHKSRLPLPLERILLTCPGCFNAIAVPRPPKTLDEALEPQVLVCPCGEVTQAPAYRYLRDPRPQTMTDADPDGRAILK